jgi:integrase
MHERTSEPMRSPTPLGSRRAAPLETLAARWLQESLENETLAPRTVEGYTYCLSLLVQHGVRSVAALTRANVEEWLRTRKKADDVKPPTLKRNLSAVCSFASWLVEEQLLARAIYEDLQRIKIKQPLSHDTPFFLTPDQARELIRAARSVGDTCLLAVVLALATGTRASEIVVLERHEIFLDADEPYIQVRSGTELVGATARAAARVKKRNKRRKTRSVPLDHCPELVDIIRPLLPRTGPLFPGRYNRSERYAVENTIGRLLAIARAAAGFPADPVITFLTLRHTFASWHVQSGQSVFKVAKWLGNSVATCEKHYAALAPGGDADAARAHSFFRRSTTPEIDLPKDPMLKFPRIPPPPTGGAHA